MSKKKIALFYDDSTETGKQILEFLSPFEKRKSDIVGEWILLWIAEHGTNVPVQWLDRKNGKPGTYRPESIQRATVEPQKEVTGNQQTMPKEMPQEEVDNSLIMAGLASFM